MPTKTVLTLTFLPPTGDDKAGSKNYDILTAQTNSPDKKFPVLISNMGALYIKKGLLDPAKTKSVKLEVTVES